MAHVLLREPQRFSEKEVETFYLQAAAFWQAEANRAKQAYLFAEKQYKDYEKKSVVSAIPKK